MLAVKELWAYRSLVFNLTQRELKGKYRKSALGWLWSLLNPASTLMIYSLVFGVFFKQIPPQSAYGSIHNFAVYLFTGLVVWNFFAAIANGSMSAMISAGPLLKKIYFPAEAPVVAAMLSALFQTVLESLILVAVMIAFGNISWTFFLMPVVIILIGIFAVGLGLLLSLMNVYFRDVGYLVGIALSLLFYCTPIIYRITLVPKRVRGWVPARAIIEANPLSNFVGAMRDLLYDLRMPSGGRWVAMFLWASCSIVIGLAVFSRRRFELSEEI